MLLAIHCGMILLFLLLGLVFSQGKGAFLIAGYNTASQAEKAKYDEKALCRCMGKLMFALAGTWALKSPAATLRAALARRRRGLPVVCRHTSQMIPAITRQTNTR